MAQRSKKNHLWWCIWDGNWRWEVCVYVWSVSERLHRSDVKREMRCGEKNSRHLTITTTTQHTANESLFLRTMKKRRKMRIFRHFSFPSAFLYSSPILSFASEWGRKKISSSTPADSHKIAHTQLHEENNERKEKKLLAMKVMKRRLKIGMAAASIPEKKAIKYWSGDETKDVVEERLMAGVPTLGVKCVRQKTSRGTKSTSQHNISQRTKSSLKIQSNMRRVEVFIWK